LAFAGAWTLEPKTRQVISTTIIDRANSVFGPDIDSDDNPNFSKFESGLFIEQGLTSRVTLVGQSSFQTVSFNNGVEQISFNGFSNSSIGVRYGLVRTDKKSIAIEFHGILSGGGEDVPDGDLGRGVQFAGRTRLNSDPVEWAIDATAGIHVSKKLLVLTQGFYTQNDGTLRDPFDPVFATRSLKGQLSAVYWFKPKLGLQIGGFKSLLGRNVVDEEAIILGVWQRF